MYVRNKIITAYVRNKIMTTYVRNKIMTMYFRNKIFRKKIPILLDTDIGRSYI